MRNMRKKGLLCILAATLILTCCAAEVYAESSLRGSNFSDSDGDGICYNCTNGAFCGRGTPRSGRNCKIR